MNNTILETIGNTPLVRLREIEQLHQLKANIYAKLEYFNPFGSIKDRTAMQMITDAENRGALKSDLIIEATSGNLGIALSAIASIKKYKSIIIMPENVSASRIKLIKSYGSEIVFSKSAFGMIGSINKAKEITKGKNCFYCDQFNNRSSILAHYLSTAPEIDNDLDGMVDVIVAGIGSGGTITGLGKYFKEKNKSTQIIGVLPETPTDTIQGIGAGFRASILDMRYVDRIMTSSEVEAKQALKELMTETSIFAGVSSGAVLSVAIKLAKLNDYREKNIVVIFADSGERYI